ncbi:MAG: RNA polymerase subunit sigma-70 [Gammaproteobacteria bacterium RIFCSPHIGHO2_12_FULL_63_22]|nr:MAG: RNA polymerase subunit sigma-70 [Gammaproteobacteria bacterium RIFCSPHIGHO2_12_FULL_63_22]
MRDELTLALPDIRRFAYALTGARADADDLLQATVERILEKGAPADADMRKWSYRVAKNIWIDEIRSRRVRTRAVSEGKVEINDRLDGERVVLGAISLAEVNRAMERLPDDQRAALSLVAVEGLSYADAAQALDVPIGTVMSRIARARAALADLFAAPKTPLAEGAAE